MKNTKDAREKTKCALLTKLYHFGRKQIVNLPLRAAMIRNKPKEGNTNSAKVVRRMTNSKLEGTKNSLIMDNKNV